MKRPYIKPSVMAIDVMTETLGALAIILGRVEAARTTRFHQLGFGL